MVNDSPPSCSSPIIDIGSNECPAKMQLLTNIACEVCCDYSTGKHYGVYACDACAAFFQRSIRQRRQYDCTLGNLGSCIVDKEHRNLCRACRLRKCFEAGMKQQAVQRERGPQAFAIQRQIDLQNEIIASEMAANLDSDACEVCPVTTRNNTVPPPTMQRFMYRRGSVIHRPYLMEPAPNADDISIHEIAAELLFDNIRQSKIVGRFRELCISDQLLLIDGSWKELFVLSMIQYMMPVDMEQLLRDYLAEDRFDFFIHRLGDDVKAISSSLRYIQSLQLNAQEYDLLRPIFLFQRVIMEGLITTYTICEQLGTETRLREGPKIYKMFEIAWANLTNYLMCLRPDRNRLNEVIQVIQQLRKVPLYAIEELFFRKVAGTKPLMQLISDLYLDHKM
ncbi:unnamed protein product [Hermetia illucens]|uniref:Uncharacterized protein n=1 Tax=Hermetia illucens TaxID=343691 RepID=A0A7R8V4A6_HERIL|nr:protein tailless-like isoform X1 [Hermetia illucens]XP_037921505.1 protein tailless-like isoform X1 [Hermetia illucens]XP_037921506.1 protein tailless-like isoform X1 [Hermetia illucens]XP_037921507.1 protein tailless-like isoform X1 [Hermetia illucens]CAD7091405.1 unnamed protein product [Hermetia illucens]